MTTAHYILLLIAVLMAAESIWAMAAPGAVRERARALLQDVEGGGGSWRALFWGLALLTWLFAWFGNQWAHRTLFFIGVFFLTIGFPANRPAFLQAWYDFFLGKRSPAGIRLIYLVEFLLASGFAWIALRGL